MHRGDTRARERAIYRIAVGCANLALAAMLVYGIVRYFDLVVPQYGHRFTFFAVIMAGLVCWMVVRGVMVLLGRTGESR